MEEDNPRSALSSLRNRAKTIRAERDDLLRRASQLQDILAGIDIQCEKLTNTAFPITSLPLDVLRSIFEAGCTFDASMSETPFEILVSHVSQHFRSIALTTPSLWQVTNIRFFKKSVAVMTAAYLQRSGVLPVAIRIYMDMTDSSSPNLRGTLKLVIKLVISHIGRWHQLRVVTGCSNAVIALSNDMRSLAAPILRDFDIVGFHLSLHELSCLLSCESPSLRSMRLRDVPFRVSRHQLSLLHTLHIQNIHYENGQPPYLHHILGGLGSLEYLILGGEFNRSGPAAPITVPYLRRLEVQSNRIVQHLLPALSAPLLEHLSVYYTRSADFAPYFEGFLQGGGCQFPALRKLALYSTDFKQDTWVDTMQAFPGIEDFELISSSALFLHTLADIAINPPWSRLASVTLVDPIDSPLNLASLRRAVSARVASGCPITKLRLPQVTIAGLPDDIMTWLREQVEVVEREG